MDTDTQKICLIALSVYENYDNCIINDSLRISPIYKCIKYKFPFLSNKLVNSFVIANYLYLYLLFCNQVNLMLNTY